VTVRILDGKLSFTDAAQAMNRLLSERRSLAGSQLYFELGQKLLASSEIRIALVRYVPDRR
jgi:hypothetical protein